jgi:hypothetical protein
VKITPAFLFALLMTIPLATHCQRNDQTGSTITVGSEKLQPTAEAKDVPPDLVQAQRPSQDTVFAAFDPTANTPIIPFSVFESPRALLVLHDPFDTVKIDRAEITRSQIIWPAPSIEGSLEMVITRWQIWLRSGHDNPNPNHLYWITDLSKEQHDAITKVLARRAREFNEVVPGFGFKRYLYWKKFTPGRALPDDWTDKEIRIHEEDFKRMRHLNAKRLIDMFNRELPSKQRIAFPSRKELDAIPPIRWVSSL